MILKTVKAGPVATGTDLRNTDLAICSENSLSPRELQARQLTRRCALTAAMAAIVARLSFSGRHTDEWPSPPSKQTTVLHLDKTGEIGEIFLNADRADSAFDAFIGDAAILVSLLLQYGCPIGQIAHALKRDSQGHAASPIGAALDRISVPEVLK